MKQCFDEGEIQAFLDGELAADTADAVARHVSVCNGCAQMLAETETETAFAFAALENEFNTLVPTGRLWRKINDSIEIENKKSVWQTARVNFRKLFAAPLIAAFAGLLVCAALFAVSQSWQSSESEVSIASESKSSVQIVAPKRANDPNNSSVETDAPRVAVVKAPLNVKPISDYRFAKTNFVKGENRQSISRDTPLKIPVAKSAARGTVSSEQIYLKTIANLEKTVDRRKDEVLKPSARFSFEKDLAVANDAIAKMKSEVKGNPNNEAAKQILLASYQNKIALLNSVAEKTELMASLK